MVQHVTNVPISILPHSWSVAGVLEWASGFIITAGLLVDIFFTNHHDFHLIPNPLPQQLQQLPIRPSSTLHLLCGATIKNSIKVEVVGFSQVFQGDFVLAECPRPPSLCPPRLVGFWRRGGLFGWWESWDVRLLRRFCCCWWWSWSPGPGQKDAKSKSGLITICPKLWSQVCHSLRFTTLRWLLYP